MVDKIKRPYDCKCTGPLCGSCSMVMEEREKDMVDEVKEILYTFLLYLEEERDTMCKGYEDRYEDASADALDKVIYSLRMALPPKE